MAAYGVAVVTCPFDQGRGDTQPYRLVDWVGNSYLFNFGGLPPYTVGGLDSDGDASVPLPAQTVLFADNILAFPQETHGWRGPQPCGNVELLDGHNEFHTAINVTNVIW
jgi:hypothetical protein